MTEGSAVRDDDWEVHQATGMVAAQIGTWNMSEAAARLMAVATARGQSLYDTALLVVSRQLQVG